MSGKPMKLILTQEVTGLGAPGDVVEVAAGYGRNYLVPRGLAMQWTRGAEKQIELIQRARSAREIRSLDDAKEAATKLASMTVRLQTRAGGGGRLFGSISTADIAGRGAGRRRPRARQAQDRGPEPDQDGRRPPGGCPAAPRRQRHAERRGFRVLSK